MTFADHLPRTAAVRCEVVLQGDKLSLKPSLEEIQTGIKTIMNAILSSTKNIAKWTEQGRSRNPALALVDVRRLRYTTSLKL